MKRAALYIRVSTVEQKISGISLESQADALKQYCADHDYDIVNIYSDAGISAHIKYTKRPALLSMIHDCQEGKVDIILVTKLDRFFRSVKDYYAVIEQIGKIPWRAIWEDYETETSAGIFKVNIMLSVAQAESDRTAERVKAVREYQRQQGRFVGGKAPIGYKIVNKELVIDQATYPGMKAFFDTYIRTECQADAVRAAADKELILTVQRARKIIQNQTYAGTVGNYHCEAYLTQEQFERLNYVVRRRFTKTDGKAKRTYIFAGLLRCSGCGRVVSSRYHARKRVNKKGQIIENNYKTYRCQYALEKVDACANKGLIYESVVEKYLLDNLDEALKEYKISASVSQEESKQVQSKISSLKRKMARIGDRYEADEISREEYVLKIADIKKELDAQQRLLQPARNIVLPDNWKDAYSELTDKSKQEFWRSVIDHIEFYSKGIPGSNDKLKIVW